MAITLAFDVYGTLIDTHGVGVALKKHVGDKAAEFSRVWREKQLEYSFRRGLMRKYEDFSVCTGDALDYASAQFKVPLSQNDKRELLAAYKVLPAFDDVEDGLAQARDAGFRIFAFSNGTSDAVETLLKNARIRKKLLGSGLELSVSAKLIFQDLTPLTVPQRSIAPQAGCEQVS